MTTRTEPTSVVVVGAGQGGYRTAACLRERGFAGGVTLIGAEDTLPYERPPLSKAYLRGETGADQLWLRPVTYYVRQSIDLVMGTVTGIDRAARTVRLSDGTTHAYGHLVLATGARPRTLDVPGAGLRGVHTLRTVRDAGALRDTLALARHVVVVGAGLLGLECAATARGAGCEVTVVEAQGRPLTRVASAPTAAHLTRLHRAKGTRLLFGREVAAVRGTYRWGRVAEVELTDGSRLPADLVLVAVGVSPRTELAAAAGLPVGDGITVDSRLLTADPHISAVGDCAAYPSARSGHRVRLEAVQNAVGHARLVAARLAGAPRDYTELPWFWSEQWGTTVQIAGYGKDHDSEVVLGDDPDAFSVLLFRGRSLRAVESVNRPGDHMAARQILGRGVTVTPEDAAAAGFTLDGHLARHR
jgi:3-phenylpropionate/trans-cinnamate dioxygenase ferredoxin reductase subunit